MKLIEVKVRYVKETEDGNKKKVTETYLVDAITFTEAEERITEEMRTYHLADFTVDAVRKSCFSDQILANDGKFYKVKVRFSTVDERNGKVKNTNKCYLVQALSVVAAFNITERMLKDSVMDTEITAVSEANIVDIIMEDER